MANEESEVLPGTFQPASKRSFESEKKFSWKPEIN